MGDLVWIRNVDGRWHTGEVSGETTRVGQTLRVGYSIEAIAYPHISIIHSFSQNEGLFYPVVFCYSMRKYFAPLNGEIKPDTAHTRRLLMDAGWL
jgi:hypothetical protein